MHRVAALLALLLPAASDVGGQVLDDGLVPRGLLRVEVSPIFTSWGSRFGRLPSGETRREELGEDLTSAAAHALFPGADDLRSAVESMTGVAGYSPALGETHARITKDITRVEFGAHVGVFDWLTIGAMLPVSRARTNLDVWFRADTLAGDLGLNPGVTSGSSVSAFLTALANAESSAQTNATQVCTSSPGSAACTSAQTLAARASAYRSSASTAYGASAFFPFVTSATATSLLQSLSSLSGDLIAAGLPGISTFMPFATEHVAEDQFWTLPGEAASGVLSTPLAGVKTPLEMGDMELSAIVRILDTDAGAAEPSGLGARLLATALVRLPTGKTELHDVLLDLGTGDGQLDFEGRLLGELTLGRRLGLQAGGRYGVQRPRTLIQRVAPPETVLAPWSLSQVVEWTPGSYLGVEVAPVWRFTGELDLVAEYRFFQKRRDSYEMVGPSFVAADPSVLEVESGITVHEVGGSLRYDTLSRLGAGVRPIQAYLRVHRAVAGGGGQTPVTTQVELGVRLFRRVWGN
jgi:hypothetical protein